MIDRKIKIINRSNVNLCKWILFLKFAKISVFSGNMIKNFLSFFGRKKNVIITRKFCDLKLQVFSFFFFL